MDIRKIKQKISFLISLILLFLLVNSCNNPDKQVNSTNEKTNQDFIKIIPKPRNGLINPFYERAKEYSIKAGLNIIEDGFDSIFIRIWYPNIDTIRVLDFKKKYSIWAGELNVIVYDQRGDSTRIINKISGRIFPKSGLPFFIDSIISKGITTLPDSWDLPVYSLSTHSYFLYVEIATTTKYRIYTYGIPYEPTGIREVASIMDIMKFIETELGILSLDKYYFLKLK